MRRTWLLSAVSVGVLAGPAASRGFVEDNRSCSYEQSNRAYRCENGSVIQYIASGTEFCPEQTIDLGIPCTNPQTGETMSWPEPDEAGCVWRTSTFCAGRSKIRYRCRDNSCGADRYDFAGWAAGGGPDAAIDGCFQQQVEEVSADCGGGTEVEKSAPAGGGQSQPLVVNAAVVSNTGYHYAAATTVQNVQSQTPSNPFSGLSANGYVAMSGVSNGPPTGSNTPTLGGSSTEPGVAGFLMDYFQNLFDGVFARNRDLIHSRDVRDNPADAAYEHTSIMRDVLNEITRDLPSLVAAGVDAALGTGATLVSNLSGFVMGLIQANTGIEMPNLDFAGHMVLAAVAYSSGNIEEGNRQTALAVADLQGDIAGTEAAIMDAATRNQNQDQNQNNQPDRRSENEPNTVVAQNETNNGNQSGSENGNGTGEGSTASGDSGATGESGETGGFEGGGGASGLGDDELEVDAV